MKNTEAPKNALAVGDEVAVVRYDSWSAPTLSRAIVTKVGKRDVKFRRIASDGKPGSYEFVARPSKVSGDLEVVDSGGLSRCAELLLSLDSPRVALAEEKIKVTKVANETHDDLSAIIDSLNWIRRRGGDAEQLEAIFKDLGAAHRKLKKAIASE